MRTLPAILALLLFVAPSFAAPHPKLRPYTNREKGFTIEFPKAWDLKENILGASVLGVSPRSGKRDQFRENVNVVVGNLPKPTRAKDFFDLNIAVMRRIYTDFQIAQLGVTRLGKDESRWVVYTHRMKTMKVKVLLYLVTHDLKGYAITCSALPGTFAKYLPTFQSIGKSFRAIPLETPSLTRK